VEQVHIKFSGDKEHSGYAEVRGLLSVAEGFSTHAMLYHTIISSDNAYTSIKLLGETRNIFVRWNVWRLMERLL